jgi:hypothetical protein
MKSHTIYHGLAAAVMAVGFATSAMAQTAALNCGTGLTNGVHVLQQHNFPVNPHVVQIDVTYSSAGIGDCNIKVSAGVSGGGVTQVFGEDVTGITECTCKTLVDACATEARLARIVNPLQSFVENNVSTLCPDSGGGQIME